MTLLNISTNLQNYYNIFWSYRHNLGMGSKGLSNENFKCAHVANVSGCPKLIWMNNSRIRVKFKGSSLKKSNTSHSKKCGRFIYCL